ncbi:Gfo/Idh/MocA family protein [Hungatella hathewayi]|uniref:Gfo/Idh/MocA family protein n=1 Tax=Hungatella hathewayi TaxID=154046 RepID=UPI0035628650
MKKAAVIGLGDISKIHIPVIEANPDITLCAVCDNNPELKETVPEGAAFYTDYREMAEKEKPDCVHVCLPHYLHYPVTKELVEMGCNVFCEKPVALNSEEAELFVRLEEAHPEIRIGICLQNRLNESVELLKEIIESGEYGQVVGTRGIVPWYRPAEYYSAKPWRGRWDTAGGGCMINQSVHTLDLLYYLGGDIKGLNASVSQILDYGIEVEDTVTARLDYVSGAKGLFFATNANYKNEAVQIAIQLERGEFRIEENILYQILPEGGKKKLAEDRKFPGTHFYYGASHGKLIDRFYRVLEMGEGEYIRVKDAKMSIRLIDAILESGKSGSYKSIL